MKDRFRGICECGDHAWADITRGYVVLVSPEDAALIRGRRWRTNTNDQRHTPYATSSVTVAPKLRAGMVAVNNWGPAPGAPFGGYKQSGNGREGGLFGLKDFMEMKAISGIPA